MPRTYISALLTFRRPAPTASLSKSLQKSLNALAEKFPFLSGRVVLNSPCLEITYSGSEVLLLDKGYIGTSYDSLARRNMPPSDIPVGVWPFAQAIDEDSCEAGAPVFGASMFRFADDSGIGICVSMHHNVVDGNGFAEVIKLWTKSINSDLVEEAKIEDRHLRLGRALEAHRCDLKLDPDALFAKHQEYSKQPPALPAEFPPCMSKVLGVSMSKIESTKKILGQKYSTNTILSAFVWAAITQSRLHRYPHLSQMASRLATAVNGRQRISPEFSTAEQPYLGNVVLYAIADVAVEQLISAATDSLAKICEAITASQAPTKINARHISEVHNLVTTVPDHRAIFPGWDLFNSRDLTITSWADLDIYASSFGSELGKPEFVRVPYSEADGVAMILPRKRGTEETIEVMVMLRRDDMQILEKLDIWA